MLDLAIALRGNLIDSLKVESKVAAAAVTTVIRRRTSALKRSIRGQMSRAGLGKLANAARSETDPHRGFSLTPKGAVFSKAIVKRPGGSVDLLTVFDEGAVVQAKRGTYLAIPVTKGSRRKTPASYGRGALIFIPNRDRKTARLVDKADRSRVIFWLVRITHLKKRLNLDTAVERSGRDLDGAIAREWERRAAKAGIV